MLVSIGGEAAVRSVQVGTFTGPHLPDFPCEVAQFPDRETQPLRLGGAGGKRERVLPVGERRAAQGQPRKLAGVEGQAAVPIRAEDQRPGVSAFGRHALNHVRAAHLQPRLDHAHVSQQTHPEDAIADPKSAFRRCANVVPYQHDVPHRQRYCGGCQEAVSDAPGVIMDLKGFPPERTGNQHDQRQHRCYAEAGAPGCGEHIQQPQPRRIFDEKDQGMREHDHERYKRHLPVEKIDDVAAIGRLEPAKARSQHELQAHHRQPGKADRDGKLAPNPASGRRRPHQQKEQRRQRQRQVEHDPKNSLQVASGLLCHTIDPLSELNVPQTGACL